MNADDALFEFGVRTNKLEAVCAHARTNLPEFHFGLFKGVTHAYFDGRNENLKAFITGFMENEATPAARRGKASAPEANAFAATFIDTLNGIASGTTSMGMAARIGDFTDHLNDRQKQFMLNWMLERASSSELKAGLVTAGAKDRTPLASAFATERQATGTLPVAEVMAHVSQPRSSMGI